jgi:hypothetical protein
MSAMARVRTTKSWNGDSTGQNGSGRHEGNRRPDERSGRSSDLRNHTEELARDGNRKQVATQ